MFLLCTARDLAISRVNKGGESRHATENRQAKSVVLHFGGIWQAADVSVPTIKAAGRGGVISDQLKT